MPEDGTLSFAAGDLTRLSAADVARGIREGRTSAVEVVDACLRRIEAVDDRVGAFARVLDAPARETARARDADLRAGRRAGPLHGVPVAIKDLVAIEGVPMAAGSAFLREPSRETATVVRRLEAAGAVIIGTTTLHEFALGMTSVNPHGRYPRNPWDLERIAGGSSGGSAAAVAAGLAPAAIGSDTGGSIRIPAALCGIVGLKPTFGRVSRHGVLPLAQSFDTVGPMARAVEDAALLLEAIAGPDPADPAASAAPVARYTEEIRRDPAGLRVGRLSGPFFDDDLDPALARSLDEAARLLEAAGMSVRSVGLKGIEAGQPAQITVLLAEAAAFHSSAFSGREAHYGADVRRLLDEGASTPRDAVDAARDVLAGVKAEVAEVLRECHVLLCPALPIGAPRIADVDPRGERWLQIRRMLGRFSRLFNTTGLPTIALPAALTGEGLPVAVQLAAAPFQEGLLLAVARRLEAAMGWSIPELPRA